MAGPQPDAHQAATRELVALGVTERDSGLFTDPNYEVGAVAGPFGACVGWLDVSWEGPAEPTWQLQSITHIPHPDSARLRQALQAAHHDRQRSLCECEICHQPFVPGRVHRINSQIVCHGCSEMHLGVVH